jgi:hypothetical protein
MIERASNPFVIGPAKSGGNAAPGQNTDRIVSEGMSDQMRRSGRVFAENLSSVQDGVGESPTEAETAADPPKSSIPSVPGQGYRPTSAPVSEEGPVIRPQDIKQIDGEGNVTDASSDVDANDLEQGDGPNGADGGDTDSAGMFSKAVADIAKDYQAPEPDGPYNDGPGNPSSDPLTGQVQRLSPERREGGIENAFDDALGSIAPPDMDTVLRPPTLISGEIGGRLTDGDDPSAL